MYKSFITPNAYFIKTRLSSKLQRISWLFVYVLPTLYLYFNLSNNSSLTNNIITLILTILITNYVYENGYIQNDVITSKKEHNPTIRLSKHELSFARTYIVRIFIYRTIILSLLLLLLYFFTPVEFFLLYLIVILLLQLLYIYYNSIRSIVNLFLITPLSFIRFYAPIIPFLILNNDYKSFFLIFTLYPLLKTLEFTKKSRYNLKNAARLIGDVDRFRVFYYLFLLTSICIIQHLQTQNLILLINITLYYLIFRISGYFLLKNNLKVKNSLTSNSIKDFRE